MRGCAAAVLVLFVVAAPALSQCGGTPVVVSAQFRSTIYELALDGTHLWAATGYGLTLYDISADPPLALDSLALGVSGTTLYATDGDASVEVFSAGNAPQRIGAFTSLLPRPTAINVNGGLVYVSDGLQTDILSGTGASLTSVAAAAFPFGSNSLA